MPTVLQYVLSTREAFVRRARMQLYGSRIPAGQVNYQSGAWKRLRQVSTIRSQLMWSKHSVCFAKPVSNTEQMQYIDFLLGKRVLHTKLKTRETLSKA